MDQALIEAITTEIANSWLDGYEAGRSSAGTNPQAGETFSWTGEPTKTGGIKAVGSGEHAGQVLYGEAAKTALENQGKAKPSDGGGSSVDSNPNKPPAEGSAGANYEAAKQHLQNAINDPAAHAGTLADSLKKLGYHQLNALKKELGIGAQSVTKKDTFIANILGAVTGEKTNPNKPVGGTPGSTPNAAELKKAADYIASMDVTPQAAKEVVDSNGDKLKNSAMHMVNKLGISQEAAVQAIKDHAAKATAKPDPEKEAGKAKSYVEANHTPKELKDLYDSEELESLESIAKDVSENTGVSRKAADIAMKQHAAKPNAPTPANLTPLPTPTTPAKSVASTMPEKKPDLTDVKALGGSTGAKLVKDTAGNLYVHKDGSKGQGGAAQLKSEAATDALYRAVGADVPDSKLYEDGGKPVKLAKWVNGEDLGTWENSASSADKAKVYKQIGQNFAADALFANWDVIGLSKDNIKVGSDGKVYRIDNGGALDFRAQGGKKPFTDDVAELDTLRDPGKNPNGAQVFAHLSDQDIALQVQNLAARKKDILAATPEPLRATMENRLKFMQKWGAQKLIENSAKTYASTGLSPSESGAKAAVDALSKGFPDVPKAEIMKTFNSEHKKVATASKADSGKPHSDPGQSVEGYKGPDGYPMQHKGNTDLPDHTRPHLTKQEAEAIDNYCGAGYSQLNAQLRQSKGDPKGLGTSQKKIYTGLKSALLKAPVLSKPVTVYRGVGHGEGSADLAKRVGAAIMQGQHEITLDGFTSTSTKTDSAFGGPKIEIQACHGLDARVYGVSSEYEMLLDEGSRFQIDSWEIKDGQPYVKLTQLPPKTWKGK